jgi:dTDP-L-rhamnose 4-epimerase
MARSGLDRSVIGSSMVVFGDGDYLDPQGNLVRPAPRTLVDLEAGHFEPFGIDGSRLRPTLVTEASSLEPQNVYAATKLH